MFSALGMFYFILLLYIFLWILICVVTLPHLPFTTGSKGWTQKHRCFGASVYCFSKTASPILENNAVKYIYFVLILFALHIYTKLIIN